MHLFISFVDKGLVFIMAAYLHKNRDNPGFLSDNLGFLSDNLGFLSDNLGFLSDNPGFLSTISGKERKPSFLEITQVI